MDLPGYQLQREIGRGGAACVWVATQRRTGRRVAVKLVAPELSHQPGFRERFLDEARIHLQLSHPNIVRLLDVGSHGSQLFLVMEYLEGGDLRTRLQRGLHVHALIRVMKQIARALDHAHALGFVHRDIKPENVLFRADGTVALADFGIAGVADGTASLSAAGTVLGSARYMSPEQAAGQPTDARSDLYSLGVLLYSVLSGEELQGEGAGGGRQHQDALPRLPSYLVAFQVVVDRAMAKQPTQRFQSGAEFAEALDAVRVRPDLPSVSLRSQVVTTQEIRAVGAQVFSSRDPVRAERSSRRRRRRRLTRHVAAVVLLVAGIGGASLVLVQQPEWVTRLSASVGIIDDPLVEEAWNSARSLRQDPNQSLATIVASHRRVLSLDPDHERAAAALAGLASQWKDDIAAALERGDLAQAENKLDESLLAFPEDDSLQQLAARLTNRKRAERLLASTQTLIRSHGLSDIPAATAAIQAYHEVLRLAPAHQVAQTELNALGEHYAGLAAGAARAGEVEEAIAFLDRASAASPELPELRRVRQMVQQAATVQSAIDEMLQKAGEHRAAGALINPPGQNAAELYHRVLATDPDNVIATQGLSAVVSQLVSTATRLLAEGELGRVRALIGRASAVGLDPEAINRVKTRLDAELGRLATVQAHLADAESLLAQGYITEPQDRNAVSLLREVERLDPGNQQARLLLERSAERLAGVAREAWEAGLPEEAREYLELALTVTPDVAEWRALRARWDAAGADS